MPDIKSFHPSPHEAQETIFTKTRIWLNSLDVFTKSFIVIFLVLVAITPVISNEALIFHPQAFYQPPNTELQQYQRLYRKPTGILLPTQELHTTPIIGYSLANLPIAVPMQSDTIVTYFNLFAQHILHITLNTGHRLHPQNSKISFKQLPRQ